MIEVTGVHRYPLTGARAESLEIATVAPAGIKGDRVLVLYDGNNESPAKPRVSQLRARPLATVAAVMAPEAVELYSKLRKLLCKGCSGE